MRAALIGCALGSPPRTPAGAPGSAPGLAATRAAGSARARPPRAGRHARFSRTLTPLPLTRVRQVWGDVGEEKEAGAFAGGCKEAKHVRAFATYQLLAAGTTFRTHFGPLLRPARERLGEASNPKVRAQLAGLLQAALRGGAANPTAAADDVAVFVYASLEGGLAAEEAAAAAAAAATQAAGAAHGAHARRVSTRRPRRCGRSAFTCITRLRLLLARQRFACWPWFSYPNPHPAQAARPATRAALRGTSTCWLSWRSGCCCARCGAGRWPGAARPCWRAWTRCCRCWCARCARATRLSRRPRCARSRCSCRCRCRVRPSRSARPVPRVAAAGALPARGACAAHVRAGPPPREPPSGRRAHLAPAGPAQCIAPSADMQTSEAAPSLAMVGVHKG